MITFSPLTNGVDLNNNTTFSTASFSPTPGRLLLAFVLGDVSDGTANADPTMPELNGILWTKVDGKIFGVSSRVGFSVFQAFPLEPVAGSAQFVFTKTQTHVGWYITEAVSTVGYAYIVDHLMQVVTTLNPVLTHEASAIAKLNIGAIGHNVNTSIAVGDELSSWEEVFDSPVSNRKMGIYTSTEHETVFDLEVGNATASAPISIRLAEGIQEVEGDISIDFKHAGVIYKGTTYQKVDGVLKYICGGPRISEPPLVGLSDSVDWFPQSVEGWAKHCQAGHEATDLIRTTSTEGGTRPLFAYQTLEMTHHTGDVWKTFGARSEWRPFATVEQLEGSEWWYGMKMWFPTGYPNPIDWGRIFLQMHGGSGSPVWAFRHDADGTLRMDVRGGDVNNVTANQQLLASIVKDHSYKVKWFVKCSSSTSGQILVYIDDVLVATINGRNKYFTGNGYLKTGMYGSNNTVTTSYRNGDHIRSALESDIDFVLAAA